MTTHLCLRNTNEDFYKPLLICNYKVFLVRATKECGWNMKSSLWNNTSILSDNTKEVQHSYSKKIYYLSYREINQFCVSSTQWLFTIYLHTSTVDLGILSLWSLQNSSLPLHGFKGCLTCFNIRHDLIKLCLRLLVDGVKTTLVTVVTDRALRPKLFYQSEGYQS